MRLGAGKSSVKSNRKRAQKLVASGNYRQAKSLLSQICRSQPGDAGSWRLMGIVDAELGSLKDAVSCLRQAVVLCPDDVEAHYCLGNVFSRMGQWRQAIACYQEVLGYAPAHKQIYSKLGIAWAGVGDYLEAKNCLGKALKINPGNAEAHVNLGIALEQLGLLDDAVEAFEAAVRLRPGHVYAYQCLAHVSVTAGKLDDARSRYQEVLQLAPDNRKAIAGLVKVFERQGEYEEAGRVLTSLPESGLDDPEVATAYGSVAPYLGQTQEAISVLERVVCMDMTGVVRSPVHYRLGNLYESLSEFDRAFEHFAKANAAQKLSADMMSRFIQTYSRQVEDTIQTFTAGFLENAPRAIDGSGTPIFIVGMPRSGTSLVEQVLSSHAEVSGAGELTMISDIAGDMPRLLEAVEPYPACMRLLSNHAIQAASGRYLDQVVTLHPGVSKVTDKMPHSCLMLGLIHLLFPEAPIIHCCRDPLDTGVSIFCNHFPDWHAYSTDLVNLGRYYRQYQRVMAHWESLGQLKMMSVRYEDLVSDTETVVRSLLDFCELDWDERCLSFHRNRRDVNTLSYQQVRQPIHSKSVGRWRNYQKYLGPLIDALENDAVEVRS